MERAVIPEPGERIRLCLQLEGGMDVRVVDRERRRVGESHDERELVVEELLEPDSVDVERPLECAARDQRNDDERLGIRRRIGDEPDPRV